MKPLSVCILALAFTVPLCSQQSQSGANAEHDCQEKLDALRAQVEQVRTDLTRIKGTVKQVAVTSDVTKLDVIDLEAKNEQRHIDTTTAQTVYAAIAQAAAGKARDQNDSLLHTCVECFATVFFGLFAKTYTDWRARDRATHETRRHRAIELETLTEIAALGIKLPKKSDRL
jgi:hypothetical protein